MATILDAELPSHDEEDVEFTAPELDSQDSQDSQDLEEEASCNADQIPVGKIQFPLKKKKAGGEDETTGEAFVFGDEDVKVTTINELECGDTIDEDDCTFNCEDEEPSQDQDNHDEGKEKEEAEDDSQDPDDEDELEADADPEDLKNFEVVCRPSTKGTDNELLKMKFKDVESWKAENQNADNMDEDDSQPEAEGEGEASAEAPAEGQAEGEVEAEPEEVEAEAEALSKICESYNEEADEDYNPIYNEDTLSDIECPEEVDQCN